MIVQSTVDTVLLPASGTAAAASGGAIYTASDVLAVRLVLRVATGGNAALFAYSAAPLTGGTVSKTFNLPAGAELVMVLQPKQSVWGAGVGGTVTVSYHASVALPLGALSG